MSKWPLLLTGLPSAKRSTSSRSAWVDKLRGNVTVVDHVLVSLAGT